MRLPEEPKKGYPIAEWCRQLVRYLRAQRVVSVIGGELKESPNGITLVIKKQELDSYSSASYDHMWKAAKAGATEAEEPKPIFSIRGGIVVVQGTRVEVADVEELTATSDEGYICLSISRESDSRAYYDSYPPEIVWEESEPTSTDSTEYVVLAEYLTGSIVQCRNNEINNQELMIVDNGEFKLLPVQANTRNNYDPPT